MTCGMAKQLSCEKRLVFCMYNILILKNNIYIYIYIIFVFVFYISGEKSNMGVFIYIYII